MRKSTNNPLRPRLKDGTSLQPAVSAMVAGFNAADKLVPNETISTLSLESVLAATKFDRSFMSYSSLSKIELT